MKEGELRL